jgi:hypothetical protein
MAYDGEQFDMFGAPPVRASELEAAPAPQEPEQAAQAQDPTLETLPARASPQAGQLVLLDLREPWLEEWVGMPEFSMDDQTPSRSIQVHFESEGDVLAFEKAVGQTIGTNLKSIWYPEAEITRYADKRYASE